MRLGKVSVKWDGKELGERHVKIPAGIPRCWKGQGATSVFILFIAHRTFLGPEALLL